MFKLVITLINYETCDRRKLIQSGRYKTREEAKNAAQKMAYVHKDATGTITHKCTVKVVDASYS